MHTGTRFRAIFCKARKICGKQPHLIDEDSDPQVSRKSPSPPRAMFFGAWAQKDSATWEEGRRETLAPKFVYRSQAQTLGQSKLFLTDVETEARGEPY